MDPSHDPELDPQAILAALCGRHGLDPQEGEALLPLVRRALTARESVRRQALRLVDQTLARKAIEGASRGPAAADQLLLRAVASLLHGWSEAG